MLSAAQGWYLEKLIRENPTHPIEIFEEPAEGEGPVTIFVSFPGLYLTLDLTGALIRTETPAQREASVRQ